MSLHEVDAAPQAIQIADAAAQRFFGALPEGVGVDQAGSSQRPDVFAVLAGESAELADGQILPPAMYMRMGRMCGATFATGAAMRPAMSASAAKYCGEGQGVQRHGGSRRSWRRAPRHTAPCRR